MLVNPEHVMAVQDVDDGGLAKMLIYLVNGQILRSSEPIDTWVKQMGEK